ncbi:hypothetical protein MNR02_06500 [Shinella sp. H4-D48]|uniref:hypothetical protein n=1 Tax=Shinella sp. H4-D48 TaxID=2925841 RepID=UPI001F53CB97|nr:hypothetical protein [Shinella sp. H4-D48]UNK39351.1 hypothetical protein MNR02_06500 [Shinella sp. H4-D48]
MRQQAADDLKQIYADLREELRGLGWDGKHVSAEVAALKGAIGEMRLDEKAKEKREEKGERVDDYVSLLTRARAREGNGYAAGRRSDGGLSILTKHEDIRTAPVTAEESPRKAAEAVSERTAFTDATVAPVLVEADKAEAVAGVLGQPDAIPALTVQHDGVNVGGPERAGVTAGETATISPEEAEEEFPSAEREDRAAANAGGDHVTSIAKREVDFDRNPNNGDGDASVALPTNGVFLEDVPPMPMKRPAFAHCFPELSNAAYERLGTDIAFKGIHDPIIRMGDVIVDGWARFTIARELGINYPVQEYTGNDVILDVIEWQRASRNFTQAQEKKIAADLAKAMPDRADEIMAAFGLAEALEAAE